LIDQYRNDFDEVIRVCGKTAVEEDLPGPQKLDLREINDKPKDKQLNKDPPPKY